VGEVNESNFVTEVIMHYGRRKGVKLITDLESSFVSKNKGFIVLIASVFL
jgi:hypothetical protein